METISFDLKEKDAAVVIKINSKIYPLHTVYSASYVFLDRCYIMLDGDPEKEILVELRLKKDSNLELGVLAREFFNELLNYAFYEEQSRKNAPLRNTLLRAALLSNIGVQEFESEEEKCNEDLEDADWSEIEDLEDEEFEDPEGIAVPWEEKYGENSQKEEENSEEKIEISDDLNKEQTSEAIFSDDLQQGNFVDKQTEHSEKQFEEED